MKHWVLRRRPVDGDAYNCATWHQWCPFEVLAIGGNLQRWAKWGQRRRLPICHRPIHSLNRHLLSVCLVPCVEHREHDLVSSKWFEEVITQVGSFWHCATMVHSVSNSTYHVLDVAFSILLMLRRSSLLPPNPTWGRYSHYARFIDEKLRKVSNQHEVTQLGDGRWLRSACPWCTVSSNHVDRGYYISHL